MTTVYMAFDSVYTRRKMRGSGLKNDELIRRGVVVVRSGWKFFGVGGDRVPVDIGQRLWSPYKINPENPDHPEKKYNRGIPDN
jgi:hypothetical protein